MDVNLLRETMTVVSFLVFIGIVVFAVHPGNKERFDKAARAPLDEDTDQPASQPASLEGARP